MLGALGEFSRPEGVEAVLLFGALGFRILRFGEVGPIGIQVEGLGFGVRVQVQSVGFKFEGLG